MIAREKYDVKGDCSEPRSKNEEHHDVKGPSDALEKKDRLPIGRGGNHNPNQRAQHNLTHFAQALSGTRVPTVTRPTHFLFRF